VKVFWGGIFLSSIIVVVKFLEELIDDGSHSLSNFVLVNYLLYNKKWI